MASGMVSVESLQGIAAMAPMSKTMAKEITGGLSEPSKMPGRAYGIPAETCITGSKLVNVKGSVCEDCYAMKHAYTWTVVKNAYRRRFTALDNPRWVEAMIVLIGKQEWFRWQDSGDLQSVEHLQNIVAVCKATPKTHHWMPTREYHIVQKFLNMGGTIPTNLVIRLSAHMVDQAPPTGYGLPTSTVHLNKQPFGEECKAYTRDNHCGDCRACWSADVQNVSYKKH